MSCLQHHLTNSASQLTVTNLNYSPSYAKHWQLIYVKRRYEVSVDNQSRKNKPIRKPMKA